MAHDLNELYKKVLNLETYAIFVQGSNEYYEDTLLHISESGNHVSLNSLGIPFAQLQAIENSARKAIKQNQHKPAQLYLDKLFYNSLNFKNEFRKNNEKCFQYFSKILNEKSIYYSTSIEYILQNLEEYNGTTK